MFVQKRGEHRSTKNIAMRALEKIMTVDVQTKNDKFLNLKSVSRHMSETRPAEILQSSGIKLVYIYPSLVQPAILKEEQIQSKVVDDEGTGAIDWSQWLDFDGDSIASIAESEGVFKIHAGMKILFIGSGENLRESLLECMSDPCMSKAKRFSYAIIESSDKVKEQLLNEYRSKHDGKLPSCME